MRTLISRAFSSGSATQQTRSKLKPTNTTNTRITRPAFHPQNPFLPTTALHNTTNPATEHTFPILIPTEALEPRLTKKLLIPNNNQEQHLRPVTLHGQQLLQKITEEWVRNELNVMGTIREETIEIFIKLLLHPSTLAPLAEKLQLRTAGRRVPVTASRHAPQRMVPASTVADEELTQLLYYLVGSMDRTLQTSGGDSGAPSSRLSRYVKQLLQHGLPHTSARQLLIRASQLSGQAQIGTKHGYARAEIRVAQLHIWGQRRDRKIRKLVPVQIPHRTPARLRKAALLKQRWIHEELNMVLWRNRLVKVSAIQENEKVAEQQRRLEHAQRVKEWHQARVHSHTSSSSSSSSSPTLWSKMFNFWPFASSSPSSSASSPSAQST